MGIKQYSRTKNTILNLASSVVGHSLMLLMNFAVRTVFIHTLGKSYLGIDGLFANILQMLSLAELGVGHAILFKLYDPIAREDHARIAVLMKFYKTMYRFIGVAVLLLGAGLIPFLPSLIRDYDKLARLNINAALIFALYLSRSVSSYLFFAYKSAIISANQKEYIVTLVGNTFTILFDVVKMVVLVFVRRFEVYVGVSIFSAIAQNYVCARIAGRLYPYINTKTDDRISRAEFIETLKDCGALMLYKLNNVVLKATDNIVLSAYLGLESVAMYSNYYLFYTTLSNFILRLFNAVAHSLGNLHTTSNRKHEYEVFEIIMLVCAILGGTAGVGIAAVSDELVLNWIGAEWVLAAPVAILIGVEVFSLPYKSAFAKYRSAMGLFQQAKYRPLAGMIVNLVVSIALVRVWGIAGVLMGTILADWTTVLWYDPIVIHRNGFENVASVSQYYKNFLLNLSVIVCVGVVDVALCRRLFTEWGWLSVLLHTAICGVTVPSALLLVYARKQEGRYILTMARKASGKLFRRGSRFS